MALRAGNLLGFLTVDSLHKGPIMQEVCPYSNFSIFSSGIKRVKSGQVRSGRVMEVQMSCYLVCYQLIAKPGNKTAATPWPNIYKHICMQIMTQLTRIKIKQSVEPAINDLQLIINLFSNASPCINTRRLNPLVNILQTTFWIVLYVNIFQFKFPWSFLVLRV